MAVSAHSAAAYGPDPGDLLLVATGDDGALRRLLSRWRQPVYAAFERLREPSAAAELRVGRALDVACGTGMSTIALGACAETVVGLDRSGRVQVFNQEAEKITGYTRAELEGQNWFEVICPR